MQPVGEIEARTIAVEWDALRAIPTVVAVAAGAHKAASVAGAVRTGAIDVLVIDEELARALVRDAGRIHPHPGGRP